MGKGKQIDTTIGEEVRGKNPGPWDDFDWGMLNGKLSGLRWVLGEEWDSLCI